MLHDNLPQAYDERAEAKAVEVAKAGVIGRYHDKRSGVEVEAEVVTKIKNGVEVFARAWKNGKPLGLGPNGTIETERFQFINPPLLVDDVVGDIVRAHTTPEGEKVSRTFREDPMEALKQALALAVLKTGKEDAKIEEGSKGNTTTTFFPSMDGNCNETQNYTTWPLLRAGSGTGHDDSGTVYNPVNIHHGAAGVNTSWETIFRCFFLFDTSAITSGATISSATFNFVSVGKGNAVVFTSTSDINVNLTASTPASDSGLSNTDYPNVGTTSFGSITYDSVVTDSSTYNTITLNGSGLAAISKTGISKFGTRAACDFSDTVPTATGGGGEGTPSYVQCYGSEQSGTSVDPTLIVVYTTVSGPTNWKTYDTVTVSTNLKTLNTNALANIKTYDTIS